MYMELGRTYDQKLETKCLEFEDLRGLTSLHFMRIKELEEIEANLRGNLAYEKGEKEAKIKQLDDKVQELKDKEE